MTSREAWAPSRSNTSSDISRATSAYSAPSARRAVEFVHAFVVCAKVHRVAAENRRRRRQAPAATTGV